MARFFKFASKTKGKMPGSLVYTGEVKQDKILIRVISYDSEELIEAECQSLEEALEYVKENKLTWINIDGIHSPEIISKVGERFNVHGLILEDILNPEHRPKFHADDNLFIIITKMLSYDTDLEQIQSDQLSLLTGKNVVISFQEKTGNQLDSIRTRIRNTPNKVHLINSDYLTYAIMDCIVDHYLDIAGKIGNHIEDHELEIIQSPTRNTSEKIFQHRTEMNFLRKTVMPLKEITNDFLRSGSSVIKENTREYLKDLNEHVLVLKETIDAYQIMVMDQMNMYNSNISNKANEIMKTLTIFAAVFIPLTFVAGVYGMNFEFIPELKWEMGYAYFWGIAVLMGVALLIYFRKRKWF